MLRTQKSLVSDVAAAKILVAEIFKKSNFFKLLAAELPAARTSKKLSFFRLTPGAGGLKKRVRFLRFLRFDVHVGGSNRTCQQSGGGSFQPRAFAESLCFSKNPSQDQA